MEIIWEDGVHSLGLHHLFVTLGTNVLLKLVEKREA